MAGGKMRILVVDDEEAMLQVLKLRLQKWGHQVELARDGIQGQERARAWRPDVVLSDVVMPELSGLELLRHLKAGRPERPVILITAHGTVDLAVEAIKAGAHDFITKPLDYSKLEAILKTAEADIKLRLQTTRLNSRLQKGAGLGAFIGTSKPMKEVYSLIQATAKNDAPVLITGESGTGKELAARTIHEQSRRARGPFIAINSAAIPGELVESEIFGHEKGAFTGAVSVRAGCFELAHGGTLFLDEIGEMPTALQPKLLRVLEDGRVRRVGGKREFQFDARILAATNRNPRALVKEGQLREDLYYRVNVFTLHLPPLRERLGDLPLLAQHFIEQFNRKHKAQVETLRKETLVIMKNYPWPGNVRELRNVIERAVVLAGEKWIDPHHLPPYLLIPPIEAGDRIVLSIGTTAAEAEKELILRTLESVNHNKAEAARRLGLDVKTIRNKLKSYGLN
ncbi:MAG: sigma-54-dependent transcriptional regulator [Acidobacteriota bacterium]